MNGHNIEYLEYYFEYFFIISFFDDCLFLPKKHIICVHNLFKTNGGDLEVHVRPPIRAKYQITDKRIAIAIFSNTCMPDNLKR